MGWTQVADRHVQRIPRLTGQAECLPVIQGWIAAHGRKCEAVGDLNRPFVFNRDRHALKLFPTIEMKRLFVPDDRHMGAPEGLLE